MALKLLYNNLKLNQELLGFLSDVLQKMHPLELSILNIIRKK